MAYLCSQALSHKPIVTGLVEQLQKVFPNEPLLEIEKAVGDGLLRAMQDESLDINEFTCSRDYARLCPDGLCSVSCGARAPEQQCHILAQAGQMQVMGMRAWCSNLVSFRSRERVLMREAPKNYAGACGARMPRARLVWGS